MYSIGEISKLTGLSQRALRLYESKSLIQPIKEKHNNYRMYCETDLDTLLIIKFYKNLDFSLDEIKEILSIISYKDSMNKLTNILNKQIAKYQSDIISSKVKNQNIKELLNLLEFSKSLTTDNFINYKLLTKKERQTIMETLRFNYTDKSIIGKRTTNHDKTLIHETDKGNLYIIADGTGSIDSQASSFACNFIKDNIDFSKVNKNDFSNHFTNLINQINNEIYIKQNDIPDQEKMGTTLSFMVLKDNQAFIGHVGDSRIYCYRNNELIQLTKDHTIVQQLIDRGEILQKDVYNHPQQNILYICLGYSDKVSEIFTNTLTVNADDLFLLMTDGIYNVLTESEIIKQIKNSQDKKELEKNIMSLVEKHGTDNASIMIIY